jgi:hypothetical protein
VARFIGGPGPLACTARTPRRDGGRRRSSGLARHGHGAGLRWASAGLVAGPEGTGSGVKRAGGLG